MSELHLVGQTERLGAPKTFGALASALEGEGSELLFAMNAGMYSPSFRPVGLYVEAGSQRKALHTGASGGNFGLQPNGVFFVDDAGPHVVATERYRAPDPRLATQSGPMLVIEGELHPAFRAESRSLNIRNGVGVSGKTVFLVISEDAVRFHDFATLFRDVLGCPDALYLDGAVSALYSPSNRVVGGKYSGILAVWTEAVE